MRASTAIPERLRRFLYGPRRHPRHRLVADARLVGRRGPLRAQVQDISRTGILLRLESRGLLRPGTRGGLLARNLGKAFLVEVPTGFLSVEATLARVAVSVSDEETVFVGCRFALPLGEETLRRLGLRPENDRAPAAPRDASSMLPLQKRADVTLTVRVHEGGGDLDVPAVEGWLVGAGERTLVLLAHGPTLDDVVGTTASRPLCIQVSDGLDPLWTVRGRLLAARPAPDGQVEVVLLADASPAAYLTARLTRRAEAAHA